MKTPEPSAICTDECRELNESILSEHPLEKGKTIHSSCQKLQVTGDLPEEEEILHERDVVIAIVEIIRRQSGGIIAPSEASIQGEIGSKVREIFDTHYSQIVRNKRDHWERDLGGVDMPMPFSRYMENEDTAPDMLGGEITPEVLELCSPLLRKILEGDKGIFKSTLANMIGKGLLTESTGHGTDTKYYTLTKKATDDFLIGVAPHQN